LILLQPSNWFATILFHKGTPIST